MDVYLGSLYQRHHLNIHFHSLQKQFGDKLYLDTLFNSDNYILLIE